MDSMWLEIVLNAKSEELDDLCARLIANGVPGLAVEEEDLLAGEEVHEDSNKVFIKYQ